MAKNLHQLKFGPKFWIALGFVACGMAVLLNLGFWQLERLEWKRGLIQTLEANRSVDAGTVPLARLVGSAEGNLMRGTLSGQWKADGSVQIGPRIMGGAWGYWIVTPFLLKDGTHVLVNRGWIDESRAAVIMDSAPPAGIVTLRGTLRLPDDRDSARVGGVARHWRGINIEGIAHDLNIANVAPLALYAESSSPPDNALLKPAPVLASLRNEHYQYALFWFGMAALLAVVFYAAAVHPRLFKKD